MKERFIRTISGDVWELSSDGTYRKPNTLNYLTGYEDSIIARGNKVNDIIIAGDLYINGSLYAKRGNDYILVAVDGWSLI